MNIEAVARFGNLASAIRSLIMVFLMFVDFSVSCNACTSSLSVSIPLSRDWHVTKLLRRVLRGEGSSGFSLVITVAPALTRCLYVSILES